MSATHVVVIAEIVPTSGREDELKSHLVALVAPTREEEGCIRYDLHLSDDGGSRRFVFVETWATREALGRHMNTPHFGAFAAAIKGLTLEPPRIVTCSQIA